MLYENKKSLTYKIITNKLLVFLGIISYSLYLWHHSIISITNYLYGDVIFYNPISPAQYQKSNAGASNTAEVFGLVESVSDVGGGLYSLNVVIYGSIVLPSSAINTISGATGGAGGADIYFLSETSGKIQIEAPTNVGSVIKPIYQAAPHGGSYTGTIINYIGYRLGGEIQAFDSSASSLTGQLSFIPIIGTSSPEIPDNFIDARTPQELLVSLYPNFYSKYGTQFGFVEEITLQSGYIANASNIGKVSVTRTGDETTSGSIVATSNDTKYYIKWPGGAASTTTSQQLKISGVYLGVQSVLTNSIYTPKVSLNNTFGVFDVAGNSVNVSMIPIMKLDPSELSVNIPQNVVISEATISTIKLGTQSSNDNIGTILDDLETRLSAVEARLLL